MRSEAAPDLSDLARLAQTGGTELRAILLRIQARAFAEAPMRDPAACAEFATLALGLIPVVTDDVLADVAALLQRVDGVPQSVADAIEDRLSGRPCRSEGDAATAPDDAGSEDRRGRYHGANEAGRDAIRAELEVALAASPRRHPELAPARRDAILRAAKAGDGREVAAALERLLGLPGALAIDLSRPAGQELFVLALVAAGFAPGDCTRVTLALDHRVARSVAGVFRLTAIARGTSRPVAALLVGAPENAMGHSASRWRHERRGPNATVAPAGATLSRSVAAPVRLGRGQI